MFISSRKWFQSDLLPVCEHNFTFLSMCELLQFLFYTMCWCFIIELCTILLSGVCFAWSCVWWWGLAGSLRSLLAVYQTNAPAGKMIHSRFVSQKKLHNATELISLSLLFISIEFNNLTYINQVIIELCIKFH